jgi:hypothetical protein
MPVARNTWHPELDPETGVGSAPADHAIGVDPVHRCIIEAAGPAKCRAEEGVLAVAANAGGGYIFIDEGVELSPSAGWCPPVNSRGRARRVSWRRARRR